MPHPDEDSWDDLDDDGDEEELLDGLGSADAPPKEDEITSVTKMFDDINSTYARFRLITNLLDLLSRLKEWTLADTTAAVDLLTSNDPVIQKQFSSILPPAPVVESTKPVLEALKCLYRVIHENALHTSAKEGDKKLFKEAYVQLFPDELLDSNDKLTEAMDRYKNRQVVDDVVLALFATPAG